jgi:hypothetical protein
VPGINNSGSVPLVAATVVKLLLGPIGINTGVALLLV